ncbi:hypothetical protein MRB53_020446 [Persea americana]|uniref:Uncharacterized protein n=1 Tax=Persea americana TaxID=3435 RepID=A0ACC2L116_PERAE|nr:hypothetical protein MRB53_020446 [Persea americana]
MDNSLALFVPRELLLNVLRAERSTPIRVLDRKFLPIDHHVFRTQKAIFNNKSEEGRPPRRFSGSEVEAKMESVEGEKTMKRLADGSMFKAKSPATRRHLRLVQPPSVQTIAHLAFSHHLSDPSLSRPPSSPSLPSLEKPRSPSLSIPPSPCAEHHPRRMLHIPPLCASLVSLGISLSRSRSPSPVHPLHPSLAAGPTLTAFQDIT